MPGWHDATLELQQQGAVQMVGIIEEQHPDRCRLFMQWKKMGWPILVDSLNLLEVTAVPITLAIDEHGVIREKRLRLDDAQEIRQKFLDKTFEAPVDAKAPPAPSAPDLEQLRDESLSGTTQALLRYAHALVMWAGPERLDEAIASYQKALTVGPGDAPTHFRLGVAFRKRYDSDQRRENDFRHAVEHWKKALDIDPNQYIWRRRIQQYGPRLDKPYSFYDWVTTARKEIMERGEEPAPLSVEPGGAEFAYPQENFETAGTREQPDPGGRIHRDDGHFVAVETTVVPPVVGAGEAARVHIVLRPNTSTKAHWNNEVDDLEYWIDPPRGWEIDQRLLTTPNPPQTVSQETRRLEFEVRCPENVQPGSATLSSYTLYYVCEDVNGTCLYRRQDITVPIQVRAKTP